MVRRKARDVIAEPEIAIAAPGVDQQVTARIEPAEQVDLVQQRRVLDDQRVGVDDRLAQPDLAIVDAAERHHRRAHPLGTAAWEGLGVRALQESGH